MITAKEFFEREIEGRYVIDLRKETNTGRLLQEYDIIELMELYHAEKSGRHIAHKEGNVYELRTKKGAEGCI